MVPNRRSRLPGLIVDAVDRLADAGPNLGRPLVDRIKGAGVHNMKELRPGSKGRSEIRILFLFDPWRSAILLVGGDKSGDWQGWYWAGTDARSRTPSAFTNST